MQPKSCITIKEITPLDDKTVYKALKTNSVEGGVNVVYENTHYNWLSLVLLCGHLVYKVRWHYALNHRVSTKIKQWLVASNSLIYTEGHVLIFNDLNTALQWPHIGSSKSQLSFLNCFSEMDDYWGHNKWLWSDPERGERPRWSETWTTSSVLLAETGAHLPFTYFASWHRKQGKNTLSEQRYWLYMLYMLLQHCTHFEEINMKIYGRECSTFPFALSSNLCSWTDVNHNHSLTGATTLQDLPLYRVSSRERKCLGLLLALVIFLHIYSLNHAYYSTGLYQQ